MQLAKAGLSVCNRWLDHPEGPHTAKQGIGDPAVRALKEESSM